MLRKFNEQPTLSERPKELITLSDNFNTIINLFKKRVSINKFELETLLAKEPHFLGLYHVVDDDNEPINPSIDALLDNLLSNIGEHPLTKTSFFDALIQDWFEKKTDTLMIAGKLPNDGHDPKIDFVEFACRLAIEMKNENLVEVSPANKAIWEVFFSSNANEDFIRAREACPLIKNANNYAFAHTEMITYFCARAIMEDLERNTSISFGMR